MSLVVKESDLRAWLAHISPLLGNDGRQLLKLLYYRKPLSWNKLGDSVKTPVDIYTQIAPHSATSGADAGARPLLMSNEEFLSTTIYHLSLLGSNLGGTSCIETLKQFKNLPSHDVVLETYSNGTCTCSEAELMEHLVKAYVFLDVRQRKLLLKHLSESHLPIHSDYATVFEVFSKLFQENVVEVKMEQTVFLSALEEVRASVDAFRAIHSYLDKYGISYSAPNRQGGGQSSITHFDEEVSFERDGTRLCRVAQGLQGLHSALVYMYQVSVSWNLLVERIPDERIEKKPYYCRPTTYIIIAALIFITGIILFSVAALVVHLNSYIPPPKSYDHEGTCNNVSYSPTTAVRLATLNSTFWIHSLSIEQNRSHEYHFQDVKYYFVSERDLKLREEDIEYKYYYNGSTCWRNYFSYGYWLKGSNISFYSCLIAVDKSVGHSNLSLFTKYYNYVSQGFDYPYTTWKNFTLIVNGSEANLNCTTHEFIVPFDTFIFYRYHKPVGAALLFNITATRRYFNATDLSNVTPFGYSFSNDGRKVEKQIDTFPPENHDYYIIAIVNTSTCRPWRNAYVTLHTTIYPNRTGIYYLLLLSIVSPFFISALVPLMIAMYLMVQGKK